MILNVACADTFLMALQQGCLNGVIVPADGVAVNGRVDWVQAVRSYRV